MSLSAAYIALLTGVLVWAVLVRKLRARPWEQLSASETHALGDARMPAAKVGLWLFLAVISSLFALFMTAYSMRMGHGHAEDMHDWHPVSEPGVLWLNSGMLVLSSIAMQWARMNVARGERKRTHDSLLVGGLLTLAFLAGQLFAWRELQALSRIHAAGSGTGVLLRPHSRARCASAGRLGRLGKNLGPHASQGHRAHRHSPEHRPVRGVLALPAAGMARVVHLAARDLKSI